MMLLSPTYSLFQARFLMLQKYEEERNLLYARAALYV